MKDLVAADYGKDKARTRHTKKGQTLLFSLHTTSAMCPRHATTNP